MKLNNEFITKVRQMIEDAPSTDKSQAIVDAIQQLVDQKYGDVVEQYQAQFTEMQSSKHEMEKFGLRSLDAEEIQFYDKLVSQDLTGDKDVLLPVKTVNYVFEDLKLEHPLFKHLDFVPAGLEQWIISEYTGKGTWGKITSAITEEVEASIGKFDVAVHMVSAFMYIPKGILELGHRWIDRFVRTILAEVLEDTLEEGFLTGTGKDEPVGLDRDLKEAVVEGVYKAKTPVAITDFGPDSFNETVLPILNKNGERHVQTIVIVANEQDIDTKIFKATHVFGPNGYAKAALPKNFIFVPSIHLERNKAIAFLSKQYQAGVTRLGIDTSKDYKFLERLMTYAIVGYGNGVAKSNDVSVVLDITDLEPLIPTVNLVENLVDPEGA